MTSVQVHRPVPDLRSYFISCIPGTRVFAHGTFGDFTITIAEYPLRAHEKPHATTWGALDLTLRGAGIESYRGTTRTWATGRVVSYAPFAEYYTVEQPAPPRVCKVRVPPERATEACAGARSDEEALRLERFLFRIAGMLLTRNSTGPLANPGSTLALTVESLCEELTSGPPLPPGRQPSWGSTVTEFLRHRIDKTPTLGEVARVAGVHRSQLARAFRGWQDCTIGDYLRRLRVEHASAALLTSDRPLAEVALDAGFCDQGHLTRVFRQLLGMPPGAFRRVFR